MTKVDNKAWFGIGFFIVSGIIIYLVQGILLPFVVGFLIAYFLNPLVSKMESMSCNRSVATLLVISIFFTILITTCVLLMPVLYEQLVKLTNELPTYIASLQEKYQPLIEKWIANEGDMENIKATVEELSGDILKFSGKVLKNIWESGMSILNILSLFFITPVVTFYMLKDWDNVLQKLENLVPHKYREVVKEQAEAINQTLSGYIRGQTIVCFILGIFYAIGLMLIGLKFALVIGFLTGIFTFIPYLGMLIGSVAGLAVAYFQFGNWYQVGLVALVFLVGQLLEGTFVTPNLIGDKVGLHPVWLIFGLLAGGTLFGFVGMLIAVPATAVIGVLVKFSVAQYQESTFYKE